MRDDTFVVVMDINNMMDVREVGKKRQQFEMMDRADVERIYQQKLAELKKV